MSVIKRILFIYLLIYLLRSRARAKHKVTRCSAIAERPRCRVRYSFRQK